MTDALRAWRLERDPATRRKLGGNLLDLIHMGSSLSIDLPPQSLEIAEEIDRDGAPKNKLEPPAAPKVITLRSVLQLTDVASIGNPDFSPVFRRISADRVEVWSRYQGWLFDRHGHLINHVHLSKRGDNGSEWYGAFLPDGQWITSYRDGNNQINAYSRSSKWRWELPGEQIIAKLPPPVWAGEKVEWSIAPSIAWARADKSGLRWEVGLGQDFSRGFALVDPHGHVEPLGADANIWSYVYPRSMGVRGNSVTQDFIPSDDGKMVLTQTEPMHGSWVDWFSYVICDWRKLAFVLPGEESTSANLVIANGDFNFGFWPKSYAVYIESESMDKVPVSRVWFFDDHLKYEGEMTASFLADAANGADLLLLAKGGQVDQVHRFAGKPAIVEERAYVWPGGTPAIPTALFDDLKFGFFSHGQPGDPNARVENLTLATWQK